jgi:hypothetical protein
MSPGPLVGSTAGVPGWSAVDTARIYPAVFELTAVVEPLTATAQDSYYLIGDESSVSVVLASLVSSCGVTNVRVTNTYINGTSVLNETALVPPEQVV